MESADLSLLSAEGRLRDRIRAARDRRLAALKALTNGTALLTALRSRAQARWEAAQAAAEAAEER